MDQNSKPLKCPVCKTGHIRNIETIDAPVIACNFSFMRDDDGEQVSDIYRCNNCQFEWDNEAELLHAITA